jgi:hypothetical protein
MLTILQRSAVKIVPVRPAVRMTSRGLFDHLRMLANSLEIAGEDSHSPDPAPLFGLQVSKTI